MFDTKEYRDNAIQQLSDATTYHVFTSDPISKQVKDIQKMLAGLVREEVLPQTTTCAISPRKTSIARASSIPTQHPTNA